jgi:NADPH-dependent glutamate synthase beta subunit-like oxidoreductase/dihydroorotate dehydrogenase
MDVTVPGILTAAQLRAELERCEYCATRPCQAACPADCSPADFIMAARVGAASDFARAAALIYAANPLGGVCGAVCPDRHCMAACARAGLDRPVNIPAVQATIIARAHELGVLPGFYRAGATGRRVAVVGGGAAGLAAAAVLAQHGAAVEVFESSPRLGGMSALVPPFRLDEAFLAGDLAFLAGLGAVSARTGVRVTDPLDLLARSDAVIVASGLDRPLPLGIPGEESAVSWLDYLVAPDRFDVGSRRVLVIGGGAVAADCAETAARAGAARVEMLALETVAELPLEPREREGLRGSGVHITGRVRVTAIRHDGDRITGVETTRVALPDGVAFHPSRVVDVEGGAHRRDDVDVVIIAIGARSSLAVARHPAVFVAGDIEHGPTTVVEAVAAGKNAALQVLAFLGEDRGSLLVDRGSYPPNHEPPTTNHVLPRIKSTVVLPGWRRLPVPLDADFFGIPIASPLLLSAGPPTDGYEQMKLAYEAGWAGGVLKTAFDGVPIHIPSEYMVSFGRTTFGNCDNVSGHTLDRVCREVERLRREFPDRLTLASTGGPVTGRDGPDAAAWSSNTRKLEAAGACGVEYSLSCPQGGDGTRGDIVSQDAELTARIVSWVLEAGDPAVPKLFKLTAAVTAIGPIITAVREVLSRHPRAAAGVTLANTFPVLAFRPAADRHWSEGVVVGMSGDGVAPITGLTLAKVAGSGVTVSANAGAMDYRTAADFLALGARTVQFCSAPMKYGVGIVDELHSGLSHLLAARGLRSVAELIGCALPDAITPFERLPARKGISAVRSELCVHCGNCTRCPYLAITLGDDRLPVTDPARCVGCSFCIQQCFTGALAMRERTPEELALLCEA